MAVSCAPVCLVTGASSGIGLAAARAMAERGYVVYGLSRRGVGASEVRPLLADVTDETAVFAVVERIRQECGRLDVVIHSAGFGISGAAEFTETVAARQQLEVNFFGAATVNRAVLPLMRQQGAGRIIHVSSVAAMVAIPFQAYYSASKAAIQSYSLALANEVRPFGISVCAVMPGDICTGFTAARAKSAVGDAVYGGRIARSVGKMERDERSGMAPESAGAFLARVATRRRIKPLYAIGVSYKAVCLLAKLLPARAVNAIVGRLYG